MRTSYLFIIGLLLFSFNNLFAVTAYLWPGQSKSIEVSVSAGEHSPTWTTTNPTLKLTGSGFYRNVTATAYFKGTATVTCSYKYNLGTSTYTRSKSWTFSCNDTHVSVSPANISLEIGESANLNWQFNHTTYMNPIMQFQSEDSSIADISTNGIITAKKTGKTTIYVNSNLGTNTAFCYVVVTGSNGTETEGENGGETAGSKRNIHIEIPGTLNTFISDADKYSITDLTLSGCLNGTDLRLLRDMAGRTQDLEISNGQMHTLDLREVVFVKGGQWYITAYENKYYTGNSFDIPRYCFAWCPALQVIYLPKNSTKLEARALLWCENLQKVEIPQGMNTIYEDNLNYSNYLVDLTLPSTMKEINTDFYKSVSLKNIHCYAKQPPALKNNGFSKHPQIEEGTLYVPKGCSDKYWRAEGWSDFKNIVEMETVEIPFSIQVNDGGSVTYNEEKIINRYPQYFTNDYGFFSIKEGGNIQLELNPNEGFFIESVMINGIENKSMVHNNTLIIDNVTKETSIAVLFKKITSVNMNISVTGKGYVEYKDYMIDEFESVEVDINTDVVLRLEPETGYRICNITMNGTDITGLAENKELVLSDISEKAELNIVFESKPILTIQHAENGSIKQYVDYWAVYNFIIEASKGWKVHTVTYNGEDITTMLGINGELTLSYIDSDSFLSIFFESETTSVSEFKQSNAKVYATEGGIIVCGISEGELIDIYNESGIVTKTVCMTGNELSIPLNRGIYIIHCDNKTFKVVI